MKEREYKFDNYKVFLIFLVVFAHLIGCAKSENDIVYYVYCIIFAFHMPAFIFVSGYFSKKNDLLKLTKKLLIPYLFFQIVLYFIFKYAFSMSVGFSVVLPKYTLWYLLCIYVYRILIDKLKNIKHLGLLSVIAALVISLDVKAGTVISIQRIFVFFPYFYFGYKFDYEKFKKYACELWVKILSVIMIFLCCLIIKEMIGYFDDIHILLRSSSSVLKLDFVSSLGMIDVFLGVLLRILTYFLGFSMTAAFFVLMPGGGKNHLSYIGSKTMSIYLFHGMVIKWIDEISMLMVYEISPAYTFMKGFVFAVIIIFVFSAKPFVKFIDFISDLPIEKLLKENE